MDIPRKAHPGPSIAESLDMVQPASQSRLSMPTPVRIPAAGLMGFSVGYTLGLIEGSRTASLRFRAEHAHKMPSSTTGWYLYHKSKNYHAMFGGLREGLKMGGRLGFWTLLAFSLESTVDRYRGRTDLLSTVLASLSVAGGFSLWSECLSLLYTRAANPLPDMRICGMLGQFPLHTSRHRKY